MSETEQVETEELVLSRERISSRDLLPHVDFDGSREQLDNYAEKALTLIADQTGVAVNSPKTHYDFSTQIMPFGVPVIATAEEGWTMSGYYNDGGEGADRISVVLEQREESADDPSKPRVIKRMEVNQARATKNDSDMKGTSSVECWTREYGSPGDDLGRESVRVSVSESSVGGRDGTLVKNSVTVGCRGKSTGKVMAHKLAEAVRSVLIRAGIADQYSDRRPYSKGDGALRVIAKLTQNERLRRQVYGRSHEIANQLANDMLGGMIDGLPHFTMTVKHKEALAYQQKQDEE